MQNSASYGSLGPRLLCVLTGKEDQFAQKGEAEAWGAWSASEGTGKEVWLDFERHSFVIGKRGTD